jgi:hypothetical protein
MRRRFMLTAMAAMLLQACSDDPEPVAAPQPAAPAPVAVATVTGVEVGVVFGGVMVSARGRGAGEGWREVRLLPRGRTADGALDFDMVGLAPAAPDPALSQRLRADLPLSWREVGGAARVRVFGGDGAIEAAIPPRLSAE